METQHIWFVIINVVGGIAVLGSYAWGLISHPDNRVELWGDIKGTAQIMIMAWMPFAAIGYLVMSWFLFNDVNPQEVTSLGGRVGFNAFLLTFAVFLICSTFWMPLSLYALDNSKENLIPWIRINLAIVGLASLMMIVLLWTLEPVENRHMQMWAIAGSMALAFQCAILDGVIWPIYFRI